MHNAMSNSGVKNRVANGFAANICNQGVTIVIQLAGIPILLHSWGVELYGQWLVLFAIPAHLSMTDLGFSQSAANDMTAKVARGEYHSAAVVFQSLIALVFTTMSCMLLLSTSVLFAPHIEKWMYSTGMGATEVRWTLWFLIAEVLAQLPDGINHAAFRAGGDYALHILLHSGIRLFQFCTVWTVALNGGGTVPAAAALFAVRIFATSAFAIVALRRNTWLKYSVSHAKLSEIKRLLRPALANISIPLAQGLNIQGMVVAVGTVLGPTAVVTFSTLRTLTRLVVQLGHSISHATEPEIAGAYGTGDRSLLRSLFLHSLRGSLVLAILGSLILLLIGDSLLDLWTRGKIEMEPLLFGFLLLSAIANVIWYSSFVLLKASNQHLQASVVFALISIITLCVSFATMHWSKSASATGIALFTLDTAMLLYVFQKMKNILSNEIIHSPNCT